MSISAEPRASNSNPLNQPSVNPVLRPVVISDPPTRGGLFFCSMPGRYTPLDEFINAAAAAEIEHVVCLVSDEEIAEKSPDYLAAMGRHQVPGKLWRLDIPDYGIPNDAAELERMLELVRERLDHDESVVIHCAGGRGRTGMVAALLLVRMGMNLDGALTAVLKSGSAPDTREQMDFLVARCK